MGGVPAKHHSKSKVGRRRAHLALTPLKLVPCPTCKAPVFPHRICAECGRKPERSQKTKAGK